MVSLPLLCVRINELTAHAGISRGHIVNYSALLYFTRFQAHQLEAVNSSIAELDQERQILYYSHHCKHWQTLPQ